MKCRSSNGLRTNPSSCCYHKDGKLVVAGCTDGSIQIWDTSRVTLVNTAFKNMKAHTSEFDISAVRFSGDGNILASRSMDGTLKLWDIRKFSQTLHAFENLPNFYAMTDVVFSPDDRIVATGTSVKNEHGKGRICWAKRLCASATRWIRIARLRDRNSRAMGSTWMNVVLLRQEAR